jgi:hypothetical protein
MRAHIHHSNVAAAIVSHLSTLSGNGKVGALSAAGRGDTLAYQWVY